MNIFIWGSSASFDCVSHKDNFRQAGCVLGESLVSLKSALPARPSGQRSHGLEAEPRKALLTTGFDILLMDFFPELLDVELLMNNRAITLSPGLLSAGYVPKSDILSFNSRARWDLWRRAWDNFCILASRASFFQKLLINKAFMPKTTISGLPALYPPERLDACNALLERLYAYAANSLPQENFISAPEKLLVASRPLDPRRSQVEYIDSFYAFLADSLEAWRQGMNASLGRHALLRTLWQSGDPRSDNVSFLTNGHQCDVKAGPARFIFYKKERNYFARILLPSTLEADGITARLRLKGWPESAQWSLCWMKDKIQYRIRGKHWLDGEWQYISISKKDILFALDNPGSETASQSITDIRILIFGDLVPGAMLEIDSICVWKEKDQCQTPEEALRRDDAGMLLEYLMQYWRAMRPYWGDAYKKFAKTGSAPIMGGISQPWNVMDNWPADMADVATFHLSLACLHEAQVAFLEACGRNDVGALCAGRGFVSQWLDLFPCDINNKELPANWHVQAASERLLVFCAAYLLGKIHNFDKLFMDRARQAGIAHARLLFSEAFYVRSQAMRFHNHGLFQDLALFVASLVFMEQPEALFWRNAALSRTRQMLDNLFILENGCLISRENSPHYQLVCQHIIAFLASLLAGLPEGDYFLRKNRQMKAWSGLISLNASQLAPIGDTYRQGLGARFTHESMPAKEFLLFPRAGYAIAVGWHGDAFFKFILIGSSLAKTHKHADNLAFLLYFDGIEWLIDPSFYNHEYAKAPAAWLRSPLAHNCLCHKDAPYSLEPGLCALQGEGSGHEFRVAGSHRCYPGLVIKRVVYGSLDSLDLRIMDSCFPAAENMCMRLHCGEKVRAKRVQDGFELRHPESDYILQVECALPGRIVGAGEKGGLAGAGFCQATIIETLEFAPETLSSFTWRVTAGKKS